MHFDYKPLPCIKSLLSCVNNEAIHLSYTMTTGGIADGYNGDLNLRGSRFEQI